MSVIVSNALITVPNDSVREINIDESVNLCWVVLDDGTQINIPLNIIVGAYHKIKVEPPRIL